MISGGSRSTTPARSAVEESHGVHRLSQPVLDARAADANAAVVYHRYR